MTLFEQQRISDTRHKKWPITLHRKFKWHPLMWFSFYFFTGWFEGQRARLVPQAVRSHGAGSGGDQDVLPCIRHRTQDELRQQEWRSQVTQACALTVHPDNWCTYQELCFVTNKPRYLINDVTHIWHPPLSAPLEKNAKCINKIKFINILGFKYGRNGKVRAEPLHA